jgi:nucleotide-binding universal stress UspA family protein
MHTRVVVPVDCSDMAWTAIGPARQLAHKWGVDLELVSIVHLDREAERANADMRDYLAACGWQEEVSATVLTSRTRSVADELAAHIESVPDTLVVMTSHGRGRSAALVGSIAEQLLQRLPDPIMVLGPSVDANHLGFTGRMLVCVDGSEVSEQALDVAAPWATDLPLEPWVIAVSQESQAAVGGDQIVESAYPHRMAERMREAVGREVEFEVLHGRDPAAEVARFARDYDAELIVAATHGRTGIGRLTSGSVAMAIVHHAPCPVLLTRVPAPA